MMRPIHLILTIPLFLNWVHALKPQQWNPPDYAASTIGNDGTHVARFDVRETLAYVTDNPANINNVFMLVWITTTEGEKYHLTTNAGLLGSQRMGTFVSLNDFQTKKARGSSILLPGSGNPDVLDMRSSAQNISSPATGDKWTNTRFTLNHDGIELDISLRPTGLNFYYGGNGGTAFYFKNNTETSMSKAVPAWSWYWSNPFTRINGSLTIDGKTVFIDPKRSFSLFERQWGDFSVGQGYYALWFYLESGEVMLTYVMEPDSKGKSKVGFSTVWYPNGLHEMVPVGPKTRAWDATTAESGLSYFNKFLVDLPAKGATLSFSTWFRDAEIRPSLPEQADTYIKISESYGEGIATWKGKRVRFFGHVEQIRWIPPVPQAPSSQ